MNSDERVVATRSGKGVGPTSRRELGRSWEDLPASALAEQIAAPEVVPRSAETPRIGGTHEALHHTEAPMEPIETSGWTTSEEIRTYEPYTPDVEQHYPSGEYLKHGFSFEQVPPACFFGYQLGASEALSDRDWAAIPTEVSTAWEGRTAGPWDHLMSAVRHAWSRVTGRS